MTKSKVFEHLNEIATLKIINGEEKTLTGFFEYYHGLYFVPTPYTNVIKQLSEDGFLPYPDKLEHILIRDSVRYLGENNFVTKGKTETYPANLGIYRYYEDVMFFRELYKEHIPKPRGEINRIKNNFERKILYQSLTLIDEELKVVERTGFLSSYDLPNKLLIRFFSVTQDKKVGSGLVNITNIRYAGTYDNMPKFTVIQGAMMEPYKLKSNDKDYKKAVKIFSKFT